MPETDQPRWPDVIGLISTTRDELSGQIKELSDKMDKWLIPTENRLTVIEANQAGHAREMGEHREQIRRNSELIAGIQKLREHEDAAIQARRDADRIADTERQRRLDWRHWLVGTVVTGLLAVPSVEYVVHLLH